ncbi:MAG: single-stranded-DNA-specific exonuclease RecJ [Johnsonella sp.]|nr:single-stranded-DNA-specific exonuclease RecJ [Johnsonella sp.]
MADSRWILYTKRADFEKISARFLIFPLTARILINRGIKEEEIGSFLHAGMEELHSPSLLRGAKEAAAMLAQKIKEGKKIRVVGDYDIDGVCSVYIYLTVLRSLGAKADYEIPDRIRDGYGINRDIVEAAYRDRVDTILTCDNGIAAFEAIERANELGIHTIVSDHHEVFQEEGKDRIPPADIVIDPKQENCPYPYKEVCGAMIAYKLSRLLSEEMGLSGEALSSLADFAAIATVGDVMPLLDENRILVRHSLSRIMHTENRGLRCLIRACELEGKQIGAYHIGFILGPCINASGRLESAKLALELFLEEDEDRAGKMAARLKELNDKRKLLTAENVQKAIETVEREAAEDKVLVIYLKDCHESLAGIIAGRIKEKYRKPCFLMTDTKEGLLKGSGRSIESYHMFQELCAAERFLIRYGGHPMAAGLTLHPKDLENFRRCLNENAKLSAEDFVEKIWIDAAMPFSYISEELIRELDSLSPFGQGNHKPAFARKDIELLGARVLGNAKRAVKLKLKDSDGFVMEGICFCEGEEFLKEAEGKKYIDIVYYPEINTYMERKALQIVIRYWKFPLK